MNGMNEIQSNHMLRINSNEFLDEASQTMKIPKYHKFKAYVSMNNHGLLVKSTLKRRSWWTITNKKSFEDNNFIWTQWIK